MSGWVLCFGDELSSSTPASVSCSLTLLRITFPFFYICLHPPPIHSYLPHFFPSNCLINPTIFCLTSHQTPSYLSHSTSMYQPHFFFNSLIFVSIVRRSPPRHSPPQTFTTTDVHHPLCKIRCSPPQTFTTPDIHHPLCKIRRSPPQTFTTPDLHHPLF